MAVHVVASGGGDVKDDEEKEGRGIDSNETQGRELDYINWSRRPGVMSNTSSLHKHRALIAALASLLTAQNSPALPTSDQHECREFLPTDTLCASAMASKAWHTRATSRMDGDFRPTRIDAEACRKTVTPVN